MAGKNKNLKLIYICAVAFSLLQCQRPLSNLFTGSQKKLIIKGQQAVVPEGLQNARSTAGSAPEDQNQASQKKSVVAEPLAETGQGFSKMCAKLVKTIDDEPWFYQFKATIRSYMADNNEASLIVAHMRYKKIADDEGKLPDVDLSNQKFDQCAKAILSFESFRELLRFNKLALSQRSEEIKSRSRYQEMKTKTFPATVCSIFIGTIESADEFGAVKDELSTTNKMFKTQMMYDLLASQNAEQQKQGEALITAPNCAKAILSFKSFDAIKKFSSVAQSEQTNLLQAKYAH